VFNALIKFVVAVIESVITGPLKALKKLFSEDLEETQKNMEYNGTKAVMTNEPELVANALKKNALSPELKSLVEEIAEQNLRETKVKDVEKVPSQPRPWKETEEGKGKTFH